MNFFKRQKPEDFWNNKHPKEPIVYAGRALRRSKTRIPIDVRHMVWKDDCQLKDIIKNNCLESDNNDFTALDCQTWVVNNIKYVGDEKSAAIAEYWKFPNETIATHKGDCEDGAILMASLMLNAGIPNWRVRVAAGMVKPRPTAPEGGHAYVTYCRETDNQWVILDWCYYEDSYLAVPLKPLASSVVTYKDVWFSFNNQYSWSHKKFEIIESIKKEPKTKGENNGN